MEENKASFNLMTIKFKVTFDVEDQGTSVDARTDASINSSLIDAMLSEANAENLKIALTRELRRVNDNATKALTEAFRKETGKEVILRERRERHEIS